MKDNSHHERKLSISSTIRVIPTSACGVTRDQTSLARNGLLDKRPYNNILLNRFKKGPNKWVILYPPGFGSQLRFAGIPRPGAIRKLFPVHKIQGISAADRLEALKEEGSDVCTALGKLFAENMNRIPNLRVLRSTNKAPWHWCCSSAMKLGCHACNVIKTQKRQHMIVSADSDW